MNSNYWKEYSPEEFETIVKNNPMTPEKIDSMFLEGDIVVFYSEEINSTIAPFGNFKYKILINSNDSPEKQKKDLPHKIAHGFYKVSVFSAKGTECPMSRIEEIITKETEDFCDKYNDYIDALYNKLLVKK